MKSRRINDEKSIGIMEVNRKHILEHSHQESALN